MCKGDQLGVSMNHIRVGFFNIPETLVSRTDLFDANPGVGGTGYLKAVLVKTLLADASFEAVLYSSNPEPNGMSLLAENLSKAILLFAESGGGVFVLSPTSSFQTPNVTVPNVRFIAWGHSLFDHSTRKALLRIKAPLLNVFLTRSTQALHFPYYLRRPSCVIGNFTQIGPYRPLPHDRGRVVCYVGALYGYKHADYLLKAWPMVVRRIPDARLLVVGSASLYGGEGKRGPLGVAYEAYEKELLYPLLRHRCRETVSFLGLLSGAKIGEVMKNVRVGVVNPVGSSETFCTSAIEFAAHGIPVIGGDYGGLKSVIPKGCGFRVRSKRGLAKRIIWLLRHAPVSDKMGDRYHAFVSDRYPLCKYQERWKALLCSWASGELSSDGLLDRRLSWQDVLGGVASKFRLFAYRFCHSLWKRIVLR